VPYLKKPKKKTLKEKQIKQRDVEQKQKMMVRGDVDVTYEFDSPIRQQDNLQSALSKKPKKKKLEEKQKIVAAKKKSVVDEGGVPVEVFRKGQTYQEDSIFTHLATPINTSAQSCVS